MAARASALLLLGASAIMAGPIAVRDTTVATTANVQAVVGTTTWNVGAVDSFPIHGSCNVTQRVMLERGFNEAIALARHARDHILRWGHDSEIYTKYFGKAPTGEPIGWYTKIADGDKAGILFRCDDIDGNCSQDGWAGHWRGSNATSETVICDLSYQIRKPLEAMCMLGYNVANGATNYFWGSDLIHRLLHVPAVGEGAVEHYAESKDGKYPAVLSLAKNNATFAARDSDAIQYFALEAYAYDIAVPGVGCPGRYTPPKASPTGTATPSPTVSPSATPASASAAAAAATSSAAAPAEACQPHGDHW
ncbi:uncharacterized protein SETTUDRAFT_91360 [Exserohilum turcica Et28A]|uniref:Putative peptidase domain-containing protein n=1 Tax=Exserohilum turcicum (strain 28A) TaxID=671987 RepID=R0K8E1_EXST2|nr:uncharacterized protein SETTUDRAFT_91360 [Exserohilum turcica Et28A]EOA84557.1 hypothetical protein SETTUDRAFT_91360 [Exserohilum turcica Et28A]